MRCLYCAVYVNATRRLAAKKVNEDETTPAKRLCDTLKEWKIEFDEPCIHFKIADFFWCNKLRQLMAPKACIKKHRDKLRTCSHCSQHDEVIESLRFSSFSKKEDVLSKPVLKRRVK